MPPPVLQPYLFFTGRCAEAVEFFRLRLARNVWSPCGAKITSEP